LLVEGSVGDTSGPEHFVHLAADGSKRCSESTQAFYERVAPLAGRLEYASLFEGRAVFSHVGSPVTGISQLYAFAPCQAPEPLGSCSAHEMFEWEDGPVCRSERRFRVMGSAFSGDRLSPLDTGYSATSHGVLRVLRDGPGSIRLSWIDSDARARWVAHVGLPEPLAKVGDAAGNRSGAALWLTGEADPSHLVIISATGKQFRFLVDIDRGGGPQVAVAGRSWGAAIPTSPPYGSAGRATRRRCWLATGSLVNASGAPETAFKAPE